MDILSMGSTTTTTTAIATLATTDYFSKNSDYCNSYLSANNYRSSQYFYATVYTMYCPVFFIAVLGNGIVCFIVCSTPRMQTVTNFFIMNLAAGDLLAAVFGIPFTFIPLQILYYWPFGEALCPVVSYMQAISVFVSAYTLVAISIDRYVAIMWPLKPRLTKKYATLIICVVWLFAIVTALPIAIVSRLTQISAWHQQCDKYICGEDWPSHADSDIYTITLMMLQFIIPLAVLLFTYTSIAVVVWCKQIPGEAENSRDQRMARSKRKMVKMMLAVVIVFTLCWLPYNILLVATFSNKEADIPALPYIWLVLHWLAMSHSCYNPIIYCYMNARFRTGFQHVLASIPCCKRCSPLAGRTARVAMGFRRAGSDSTDSTVLHRVNTSSMYITMRNKSMSTSSQQPTMRSSTTRYSTRSSQRTPHQPETFREDQI